MMAKTKHSQNQDLQDEKMNRITENKSSKSANAENSASDKWEIPSDWRQVKIKDVADIKGGFAFDSSKFKEQGKYQVIKMSNLYENLLDLNRSQSFLDDLTEQEKEYLLNEGDILITLTGTVGKQDYGYSYQIKGEKNLLLNQRVAKITATDINSKYLFYEIKTKRFLNQFFYSSRGGTGNQTNAGTNDLASVKIFYPPLPEQIAIAQLLSTWDNAITKTQALIAQKEQRKKWLMQNLLTGKMRLKGFEGEWKETSVGEIGIIQTGNTPSKLEVENWGGTNNWCTADDMKSKYVFQTIQKLSDKGWATARIARANSVLVTCIASIGVNAITKVDSGFNQQINSITPSEKFDVEFVYYMIVFSKNKLMEYAGAGALPMLNKNTFMSIKLNIPTLPEQTSIAQVLQTADKEIQLLKAKCNKLKEQKKGLMQVLLTGKVRLKTNE